LYGQRASETENLFNDILVPISGLEIGWIALDQALTVATREGGRILGLHIYADEAEPDEVRNREIEAGFYWRCGEREVDSKMVFTSGPIAKSICERARWVDIVVVKLQYPPGSTALARYSSGIARMIRGCTRPLLVVAGDSPTLNKPLILWEGRKRSRLTAMIAAYISGKWDLPLVVLANDGENNKKRTKLKKLRRYLSQYDLDVTYVRGAIDNSDEILRIARDHECDWIISAAYGSGALKEIVFGELLDELLGLSNIPILICR
jgi:nucleotide-binding universal stress UspA family protein